MINFKQAYETVMRNCEVLKPVKIKTKEAINYVLARDLYAENDFPSYNNSAMDGYAVISEDTKGASVNNPKVFEVIESIHAGNLPKKEINHFEATALTTGSIIPKGADAVVIIEDTNRRGNKVEVLREVKPGENVRFKGENVKKGECVFEKNKILTAVDIGFLLALGVDEIEVINRPKVAIISTGEELIDIDEPIINAKIRDINSFMIKEMVRKYGGIPISYGIAKDDMDEISQRIKQALICDLVVITAGASVSQYDLVGDVLNGLGVEIKFNKVAQRPGKPMWFGLIDKKLIFGLPGNPVSAVTTFEIYVRPAILKLQGKDYTGEFINARLMDEFKKKLQMTYFLRVKLKKVDSQYYAKLSGPQETGIIKSLAEADGIMILSDEIETARSDNEFPVLKIR